VDGKLENEIWRIINVICKNVDGFLL